MPFIALILLAVVAWAWRTERPFSAFVAFSLLVAAVWAWEPWSRFSKEVTAYGAMCVERGKSPDDCPGYYTLNRITYRINEARAEAAYWHPDLDSESRKLINCSIRDNRNWTCEYPDGMGSVSMRDGLEKRNTADKNDGWIYVRKHHWWYLHVASFWDEEGVSLGPFMPDQYD